MNSQRMLWADTLKALGMLFIYIGHFGPASGKLYTMVFLFHVPLFFFMSGFFHSNKLGIVSFSLNKFKKILVPYAIFSILSLIFFSLRAPEYVKDIKTTAEAIAFGVRNTTYYAEGLWFLPCLFVMSIIFRMISSITSHVTLVSILLSFSCLFLFSKLPSSEPKMWLNVDSALQYIIYYALGFLSRRYSEAYIRNGKPTSLLNFLTLLSLMLIGYVYINGASFIFAFIGNSALANYTTSIVVAMSAILVCIYISTMLSHIDLLNTLGNGSLILCGTENICRGILITALSTLGLGVKLSNPLSIVLLSLAVMMISKVIFFPVFQSLIAPKNPQLISGKERTL